MGTLFDYIEWRGDIQFSTIGVGEIDNLIFSQICYIDFKRIVPASFTARPVSFLAAAKKYMQAHRGETVNLGAIMPAEVVALTAKAASSSAQQIKNAAKPRFFPPKVGSSVICSRSVAGGMGVG